MISFKRVCANSINLLVSVTLGKEIREGDVPFESVSLLLKVGLLGNLGF